MNRRLITVLLGLGLGIGAQAFGQASLTPNVRTAGTVAAAEQATIRQFIDAQVAKLASNDSAQQAEGRDALVNAVTGDPSPSPAFVDGYSQLLNEALLKVAASDNMRARLNGAIVAARVAARAENLRLRPAIEKFAADGSEPVVLWGVKAYRPLIMTQLRSQPGEAGNLLKPIIPAIKDNLKAPVAEAAYEALRLNILSDRASLTPAMVKAVLPTVQDLLEVRIAQYQAGVPDGPLVDTLGTNFLVDTLVWQNQSAQERSRTVQLIANLIAAGAARTASLDRDRDRKDAVIQTLKLVARGVTVIAGDRPSVVSAAAPIARVDISMDAATIQKICEELISAMVADIPGVTHPKMSLRSMTTGQ